jgi:hypothetical protein
MNDHYEESMHYMIKGLIENQPSEQPPVSPPVGKLWKDTDSTIKVWTGKEWIHYLDLQK